MSIIVVILLALILYALAPDLVCALIYLALWLAIAGAVLSGIILLGVSIL